MALGLLAVACATRHPLPGANRGGARGFVRLPRRLLAPATRRPGEVHFVYRDPAARWDAYDQVLFEPVTLWRSGRKSLDPVPEGDLLRLAGDLQRQCAGTSGRAGRS